MWKRRNKLALSSAALTGLMILRGTLAAPAAQASVVVGVCTIKADLTHGSSHVNSTINGEGWVSCSIVMSEIYLRVSIEKSTGSIIYDDPLDYFNTSYEKGHAATSCSNAGTWRTRAAYVLRAPSGYNPSYASGSTYSAWSRIVCGVSSRTAPDGPSVENSPAYLETTVSITAPATSTGQ